MLYLQKGQRRIRQQPSPVYVPWQVLRRMQQAVRDSVEVHALDTRQGSGKHRQIARTLISVPEVFHLDTHVACCSYNNFPASLRWRRFFIRPELKGFMLLFSKKNPRMIPREKRKRFHRNFSKNISDPLSHESRLPTSNPTGKTTGNQSKTPKKHRKTPKSKAFFAESAAVLHRFV